MKSRLKPLVFTCFLLASGFVGAKILPSDGMWQTYDDPAIGSGFFIRTQGEITIVTLYTYREDGSPVWFNATGIISENGVFVDKLVETKNGENLFNDTPQSAEIANADRVLRLEFTATEVGTLSIDNSEPKAIHSYRFGLNGIETEQLTTPLGKEYQFPDITGQWAMGSAEDSLSFNFDFHTDYGAVADPPSPNFHFHFMDEFRVPSGIFYFLSCPTWNAYEAPYCRFYVNQSDIENNEKAAILSRLYVFLDDVGMNTMTFHLQPEGDDTYSREHPVYQAFRLDADYEEDSVIEERTFPGEGLWRALDDPAIGSGVNFHSQGDIVLMTVFTYNEAGQPIWYTASGELSEDSVLETQLFNTQGGTPIESANPASAEINEIHDFRVTLSGRQLAELELNNNETKEIKSYQFGYPEFIADDYFEETGDALKFASLEGWWLMAEENGSHSVLLNLVENQSKLTPPAPPETDWTHFDNIAPSSSSWIQSIRCPNNFANFWGLCQVFMTEPNSRERLRPFLEDIGSDTVRMYYRDENRTDLGNYPFYYFYYDLHRINPPIQAE